MFGRFKLWIGIILGLFVLAFLIAFAPIRPAPGGFQVQSTFRYTFPQPVAQEGEQQADTEARLTGIIREKVTDLDVVKLIAPTLVEVATFATTPESATRYQQDILTALQAKFPGVNTEKVAQEEQERPITQWGNVLAVYRPRVQIRLGLDLQGGAHVVLLAKPETTMSFIAPEDQPLVKMETPAPTGATPAATPAQPAKTASLQQTPEDIIRNVTNSLVRIGANAETLKVKVVSATGLLVITQAADEQEAKKQEEVALAYLQGAYPGVDVKLEKRDSVFLEPGTAEKVRNVVERRLYAMTDVREPIVQTQGLDRVIVELPGVKDPQHVTELLGATAQLQFVIIPDKYEPPSGDTPDYSTWTNKLTGQAVSWEQVLLESKAEFTGRDLKSNSQVQSGQAMDLVVGFEIRNERKEDFRRFTARNVGKAMAIVLDGEVQMAPVIRSEIPGSGIIEGNFTPQEARDLQLLLNAGALPVPLEIAENRTVSATLGQDAVQRSLIAGIVGIGVVLLFMIGVYRMPGIFADLALVLYFFMLLAVLSMAKATMTLPGIAAFIISMGMAVDANIIIFERLKEELWAGKSPRAAVEAGFDRAWTAILDSSVTTLIGSGVLYFLGTSGIKSFAVTLFLGVVVHLFTAVTVSRWMVTMVANSATGQRLWVYGVHKPEQQ